MAAVRLYQPGESGPQTLTVGDVITLYRRHCAAEGVHGPAARADRDFTFKLFSEAAGHLPVAECKPFHLTDFIEAHPEWKSVSTRRAKANAIRACFNWAAKQERIPKNPFANVHYAEHERRAEMPDDALERLEKVANKQFEAVLRFLRLTWIRTGELCRATWADVDLDRGILVIPRHKSRRFTGKPKVIALVPEAVALLRDLAGRLEQQAVTSANIATPPAVTAARVPTVAAPIFLNTRGQPWKPGVLGYQLRRLKKRHGIEGGCLHGIRHKGISAALENGAPLLMVAEQAGHATPTITVKNYWHKSAETIAAMQAAASLGVPKKS